jgi:hypothetical protein
MGLVKRLGQECGGVLAGVPQERIEVGAELGTSPRARGELERKQLQLETINGEIDALIEAAPFGPDRPATEAFVAKVTPLSWSDPRIAPLVHFAASSLEKAVAPPVTDVCADMKSWAASGYHVLSAASREFEAAEKAPPSAAKPTGSLASLLQPYEGLQVKSLIRRTLALRTKVAKALDAAFVAAVGLQHTLGRPESPAEKHERVPVLKRGRTSSGSSFEVRREGPQDLSGSSCRHSLTVAIEEASENSSQTTEGSVCLSGEGERRPWSSCGTKNESIAVAVPSSVDAVRLTLSNGRTITSPVVRVPMRDGGPRRLYVQAVRGYTTRYPISLTELNRDGTTVRVLNVRADRCENEPGHDPSAPTFVGLATSATPEGEAFTIEGTLLRFGHDQTTFSLSRLGIGVPETSEGASTGHAAPKAFQWELASECPPHEFAIVYGILTAPGSSVLARTPGGLLPLTTVPLAADLDSGGPLVYGVFSTLPTELVILAADGSTFYSENLVAKAREQSEFCEGYVEG